MADGISVLLIEDDTAVRIGSVQALQLAGFTVESFESAERAVPHIRAGMPAVVVTDVRLPGMDGLGLLRCAADIEADLPVILVTGHGDVAMAVQAMRAGAYDFIEKPFPSELLVEVVARAAEKRQLTLEVSSLRNRLQHCVGIEAALLGRSPAMEQVRRTILDLADTSANVVINGETGTGKELVARSLHEHSSRRNGRFVAVNCGGLPEQLFESEIFGHELGAFTGANRRRIGKFEWANGGTMFLDEVESLPMSLQVKLLRVLQERKIERLGANELIPLDCRVIAASQEDIGELVKRQRFRSDLYYRLNVAVIELPPLRERREDIPSLIKFLLARAGLGALRITPDALEALLLHGWPHNIRELDNLVRTLALHTGAIDLDALPRHLQVQLREARRETVIAPRARSSDDELRARLIAALPAASLRRSRWRAVTCTACSNGSTSSFCRSGQRVARTMQKAATRRERPQDPVPRLGPERHARGARMPALSAPAARRSVLCTRRHARPLISRRGTLRSN
jgi:two-component system C4-dicarboxylate transport response regulator DctD